MLRRDDPVLLLGMHRSGTTLLAQMLAEMGMHLGRNLEEHHESVFVLDANDWVLARAHGAWDNPLPLRWLMENAGSTEPLVEHLRSRVDGISFLRRFIGPSRLRAFAGDGPLLWGWKDPRTTATWPLWQEVFPRARAVTVHRNGVGFTRSLLRQSVVAHPHAEHDHLRLTTELDDIRSRAQTATLLYLDYEEDNLVGLAKEAREKSVGAINYGGGADCDVLLRRLNDRRKEAEQAGDFAEVLKKRAAMVAKHAMFHNDDDAVPVPGTVATVFDINPSGSTRQKDANLLGENYFGITKVLSR